MTQRVRSIPAGVKERMTIRPFGKAAVGDNNTTSLGEEIGIDAPGAEVRPSSVDFFFFFVFFFSLPRHVSLVDVCWEHQRVAAPVEQWACAAWIGATFVT